MRLLLTTAEPLDVERGSGTAMAIGRLRAALASRGVSMPILAGSRSPRRSVTMRARTNGLGMRFREDYDAVLGVAGHGWQIAQELDVPFVALVKAMYSQAVPWERRLAKLSLRMRARAE